MFTTWRFGDKRTLGAFGGVRVGRGVLEKAAGEATLSIVQFPEEVCHEGGFSLFARPLEESPILPYVTSK